MKSIQQEVEKYLKNVSYIGASDEEIQRALKLSPQSEVPRRRELVKLGRVVDSGSRSRSKSGRTVIVWIHKECSGRS